MNILYQKMPVMAIQPSKIQLNGVGSAKAPRGSKSNKAHSVSIDTIVTVWAHAPTLYSG
jgi:hypothetical protein